MIRKHLKKLVSLALAVTMVMGMSVTAFASEIDNTSVSGIYSPEFPDAYIITETVSAPVSYSLNDEDIQPMIVTATIFVEESHTIGSNGEVYISNSRLLSKEEVDNIGIDNFDNMNTLATSRAATNSYGKLTLTFSGTHSKSGNSVSCNLTADADWDFGAFTSPEKRPAVGKDFIGITWSGSFTTNSSSCKATDLVGNVTYPTMVDSIANSGRVWSFEESLYEDHFANYNKNIHANMTIKKNNMTGNGNTAEAVLKYIHTYQKAVGGIFMSRGSDSISAGFTLSNVDKQWSLVCTVTNIPY